MLIKSVIYDADYWLHLFDYYVKKVTLLFY